MIKNYLKLLRIHQWIKNLFVFAPVFFGFGLFNFRLLEQSTLAFFSFCFVSSSIYIFNDIFDIEFDRKHPTKRSRPLASGAISPSKAIVLSLILIGVGLLIAYTINISCLFVLLVYGIINVSYTLKFKHLAIIDIFCISTGFVLRVFMGGVATGIALSHWIIVMTFLLALLLALAKRRDDVLLFLNGNDVRKAIEGYNLQLIDITIAIVAAVTLVAYLMYSFSPNVIEYFKSEYVYVTSVFVLLGIIRYLQLVFVFEKSASPTNNLLKDTFLQLTIGAWIISFLIIMYEQ